MKKKLKNILVCLMIIFCVISMINGGSYAITVESNSNAPNIPVVVPGLTPVKYENNKWVEIKNVADNPWYNDRDWYDYENGSWANAKLNDGTMYVWIPRFTYKITGNSIDIKWSDGKEDVTSDGYLKHPAFYFGEYLGGDTSSNNNFIERNGERNELTGFWIQKDLFSSNINDVSVAFDNAIKITSNASYGLPQSGTYTHMLKASEWGALAYLTAAKGSLTGGNITTINKTGVEIGSASEYVSGIKGTPVIGADMLKSSYKKYRDKIDGDLSKYLGYALTETTFLANTAETPSNNSFLVRGGSLGLFGYTSGSGADSGKGYRTSISIISEELTDTIAFFDTETSVVSGDYLILGVDFSVSSGGWKFPEEPSNFFSDSVNADNKKIVDIDCIYEGSTRWKQSNLNATVIKMIDSNMAQIPVESIKKDTVYPDGKYTLIIRVGGKINDTPVFMPLKDMDVKIVVNELNLKDTSGNLIKIGNIPNNKVRLNVFGGEGSSVITKVILKDAPSKTEYDLEEELNLNGGTIVPYIGNLAGEEVPITISDVVNPNITDIPGEHLVELQYEGVKVIQDSVEFRINVSDVRQLVVTGKVKAGSNTLNSQLLKGPGKYSRTNNDVTEELVAYEYLSGYLFSGWSSNSTSVKANSSNYSTTFTVPSKTVSIDKDDVVITANYIAPDRLTISGAKTEFIVNENFSLGANATLKAVYVKDGVNVEKEITIGTSGVKVIIKDNNDNIYNLDKLQLGKYNITIEYASKSITYSIEVVNPKYSLSVYTSSMEFGNILGDIKNPDGVKREDIILDETLGSAYKLVSFGDTITLRATPKEGYVFGQWKVTGDDSLISNENINKEEISFLMPEKEIRIDAEFIKSYTVKFKIKEGQEGYGTLIGELTQNVLFGQPTTVVTVKPNTNYVFSKWLDSQDRIISTEEDLICSAVMADEEYTAVFDNVWTVSFYNGETLFKTLKVSNGNSAHIAEVPTKYAYVFTGWDKDLSNITSDLVTYAQYVPRINIEENTSAEEGTIDAQITGTMIKEGTLAYMISPSPDNAEGNYSNFELDEIFTGFDGDWYNLEGIYRDAVNAPSKDSSSLLTISSSNATEVVKFEYILSSSEDAELGITINGEKVVTPSEAIPTGWNSFEKEVPVINGEIKVGISYSQGETYTSNDFAAIRNLAITRQWTIISNDYHLLIPTEFGQNYIHVKGTGSDDLTTIYRAVSECFSGIGSTTYIITYNANGGSGAPSIQAKTKGEALTLSSTVPTKGGYTFLGWSTSSTATSAEYSAGGSFTVDANTTLYAVWQKTASSSSSPYTITTIEDEGANIEGVYSNHRCSECGGTDHECEVINIMIEAENATVTEI